MSPAPSNVIGAPAPAAARTGLRAAHVVFATASRRALLAVLMLAAIVALLGALCMLCLDLLSAARAYVGGESLWSKAQKSAVRHLGRYADTRADADWRAYLREIAVPLGDRDARLELEKAAPDLAVASRGLIAGGNHPDDVAGMIRLYRWFRDIGFMSRAIGIWAEGDTLIAALVREADGLRAAVLSGGAPSTLRPIVDRIDALDERLTPLEVRFSATLGEATRRTQQLLTLAAIAIATLLLAIGGVTVRRVVQHGAAQEAELRASEDRLRGALAGSSDGFWEWNLGNGALYLSPGFETILGHEPGSIGRSIDALRALVHEGDRPVVRAALSAHLQRGEPYDVEFRLRARSGRWRWVRTRARALRSGDGTPVRLAGSITDVTDRRQAEEALRESETRFRSLWDTTSDAVLIVDAHGTIRFCNPAVQGMFGYAADELAGRPLEQIQPERLRAAHLAGMRRYRSSGRRTLDWRGIETVARHRDGREFAVEVAFSEIELAGEHHFVGFLRDISKRKQAEDALRDMNERLEQRVAERTQALRDANARLQELDRLKSEFLATMSHELRTPLNAILGFTTLLRDGMAGPVNDEQRRQLGFVHGSGRHLLALINDLLDMSRIESGRMQLNHEPFDFAEVVAEVRSHVQPMAAQKQLAFECNLRSPQMPIEGDRRRCFQVLLNLAANAVKFTDRGVVCIDAALEGDRLQVSVCDTGIGIPAEQLPQMFEAFRQLDGSLRRAHEGAGLGLYLSRKLLDLMGGTIRVDSTVGAGSRFSITLPRARPAAGTTP